MAASVTAPSDPKALIFDLIGTCCDWYSSILPALQAAPSIPALPANVLPQLAADWRAGFFHEVDTRRQAGQPLEDIDVTHRRVLNWLLLERGVTPAQWDDGVRNALVMAWHNQKSRSREAPKCSKMQWTDVMTIMKAGLMSQMHLKDSSKNTLCEEYILQ